MRDPDRLLRNPSTRLSLLLLQAGAEEKPSAKARSRTAQSVAAAAGIATASTSAAATAGGVKLTATKASALAANATATTGAAAVPAGAKLGFAVLAKWFGIGALGAVLAVPVVHVLVPARSASQAQDTALVAGGAAAKGSQAATVPRRSAAEVVAPAQPNALEPQDGVGARNGSGTVSPRSTAGTAEAPASADGSLLAIEVRFVEQGRAALQRGAFADALARLASYEDRFPKQQLLTEVLFLRMEAFSRSGDAPRARSLASLIITRDVAGPQAARAREVLAR